MDNHLENFVHKNRDAFDLFEPDSGTWTAIRNSTKRKKKRSFHIAKYAAAVIIFVAGFAIGSFQNKLNNSKQTSQIGKLKFEEQTQIIESEFYYLTQINEKMVSLKPFFASDPQLENDIKRDFNELDIFYNQLKTDLNDDINNTQVIEAMVNSYQMKLEILESLLIQLKQYNNEDIKYDI